MEGRSWHINQTVDYSDGPQDAHMRAAAVDSVQEAHRLLAVYPMASATPTTHVSRHLSGLTLTANPPSFVQPNYYNVQGTSYPQSNPPPYSEYAQEVNYLSGSRVNPNDGGYWETTRNRAVAALGEHAGPSYNHYQPPVHWSHSQMPTSAYQTTPFAQSVFQYTAPSAAYPTPPPPGIISSSSSLAFALGVPVSQPAPVAYKPEESPAFFNSFLAQTTREIEPSHTSGSRSSASSTNARKPNIRPESPDPLAIVPTSGLKPGVVLTPRKRKSLVSLESPSIKRIQTEQSAPSTSRTSPDSPTKSPSKLTPKRTLTMDYVEIPAPPWRTPHSSSKSLGKLKIVDSSPGDLGGYGSPDDAKSSNIRRNERDGRGPLQKFTILLEDLFEAEDSLSPYVNANDLPSDFFSSLSPDAARPCLHPTFIGKMTKQISLISRPNRLRRSSNGVTTPRPQGRMSEVDAAVLSRFLKMLDRSVRAGEELDPFTKQTAKTETVSNSKKKGASKGKNDRRSKSTTPNDDELDTNEVKQELSEEDLSQMEDTLQRTRNSILAADCCMALLCSDQLTKQLYSEELITACLNAIKNQLTKIIYAFVEATPESNAQSSLFLSQLLKARAATKSHRVLIAETFQALTKVIARITTLVSSELVAMSDSIMIQAVYISIGPFFVVEVGGDGDSKGKKETVVSKTLGTTGMRSLRLEALGLVRSIFASHKSQRSWIIEEILSSLIKLSDTKQKAGQFRLRDGRSIRTVSALLLTLVQTSAHDVRTEARVINKDRNRKFAMRRNESFTEKESDLPFLDEHDEQEITLYGSALDSATKSAKTIVMFLISRAGKGKATKNTNEAEYRTIFDNLISDLLAVLFWPEWPAASLLISVASKFMVSSLEDIKSSASENNAAKTIALDHLGVIAARIRSSTLKVKSAIESGERASKPLKALDETVRDVNGKGLDRLLTAHKDIAANLCKHTGEDSTYASARELTAATLGHELSFAVKQVDRWLQDEEETETETPKDPVKLKIFGQKLKVALREIWKDQPSDVFDAGSADEYSRIDKVAEEVGTIQDLRNSFQPILNKILIALDAHAIFMRTKALRALSQIVTSDPSILAASNVRKAIEGHLLDNSPAVRDAAVELIGKYMIDSPEVAGDYYYKIADRIMDTGLGVRKRVIKLLKLYYPVAEDNERRIDLCYRLVVRLLDEDDTVKDLSLKTLEELWFQPPSALAQKLRTQSDVTPLVAKVAIIMAVSAKFKDHQSPFEDMLHKIMAGKASGEASSLHERYEEICSTLIDGLVDASDLPGFTVVNCVRTIQLFTTAYPAILSVQYATTLLPYLKSPTSPEEFVTVDSLLKIFRASIPHMPKTAAKFGQELQTILQPMIIKPAGVNIVATLQEAVACICITVKHLTHDCGPLVSLLKSINNRLQQAVSKTQPASAQEMRSMSVLVVIVALLGEHFNFDDLRTTHPNLQNDLNSISTTSIIVHIYDTLLALYNKYNDSGFKNRILQCIGFLFRARPSLMIKDNSMQIMDSIFASPHEEPQHRLLKIIQEFLISESAKHSAKEKESAKVKGKTAVVMSELVGNTDDFADSGVSSTVVQRYLNNILEAVLSQNSTIQSVALDVLSFTIKQGLAHPLQSFPVIVALETSRTASVSNRAISLHTILHSKHTSLLNTRYSISARASFDYQKSLSPGSDVCGFTSNPPTALLQRWYLLVREKRQPRQDFLKSLVKVFDIDSSLQASQDDVDFARYMAENFSALDYKTQEEVLTVIKSLTSVLSTAGMQLLQIISPSNLLDQLRNNVDETDDAMQVDTPPLSNEDREKSLNISRCSVIIGMIMLLKAHLKSLYGISEDKSAKFVIGKKSAIGDKLATKRNEKPLSWERLPFATAPLLTTADVETHKTRFLAVWNEDGLAAEPEDDEFF